MGPRTCRLLGLLMIVSAVVALWFSIGPGAVDDHGIDDQIGQMRETTDQEERTLMKQIKVAETVLVIECRRRGEPAGCRPALGPRGTRECIRRVEVNGRVRTLGCPR